MPARNARSVVSASSGMRLLELLFVGVKLYLYRLVHNSKENFDQRFAVKLRSNFESLGPVYTKLGQMLSMRPDYIDDVYCQEFELLLDSGRQIPREKMRRYLNRIASPSQFKLVQSLGDPIAVASISQVYKATLPSGEAVAIKVLRPGVTHMVKRDFKILRLLARFFGNKVGKVGKRHWIDLVAELERWLLEETDYLHEARNIELMRKDFEGYDNILIPQYYPDLSSKQILVMEWIDGYSMLDLIRMKRKEELPDFDFSLEEKFEEIIRDVAIKSLLRGYFHADAHPANIMITKEGKIALIDFGLIQFFSREVRKGTILFLLGITSNDIELIFKSAEMLGKEDAQFNRDEVYEEISRHLYDYLDASAHDVSSTKILFSILKVCLEQGFQYPWSLVLYTRTAVNLDGQILRVHPGFSFSSYGRQYLLEVYLETLLEEHTSASHVIKMTEDVIDLVRDLPKNLKTIIEKMAKEKQP